MKRIILTATIISAVLLIGWDSKESEKELAEKFVDFVTSEQGQGIFKKYNYSTEPPE